MKRKCFLLFLIICLGLVVPCPISSEVTAQTSDVNHNTPQTDKLSFFTEHFSEWTEEPWLSVLENGQFEDHPVIYLTFDDGPDPKWTPKVLALLDEHHAKATFYMIGINARSEPETVLAVAEAGQMIGNHSYNHKSLSHFGYNDFYLELHDTDTAIRDALDSNPDLLPQVAQCMRPPFGEISPNLYTFASRMLYDVSMWSLDTMDWSGISGEEILDTVLAGVKPNAIILMHDGGKYRSETIRGLALTLHELTLRGYTFEPLCITSGQVIDYP